jgi:hypothetical protein
LWDKRHWKNILWKRRKEKEREGEKTGINDGNLFLSLLNAGFKAKIILYAVVAMPLFSHVTNKNKNKHKTLKSEPRSITWLLNSQFWKKTLLNNSSHWDDYMPNYNF